MTKLLLVIVAVIAVPTMAQEYGTDMFDKFGYPESIDRLTCKNDNATVLQRQETLYQEYMNCVKSTVDLKQMNMDLRFMLRTLITSMKFSPTITNMQTSTVRLYSQSYWPKIKALMNCEETYSSIYTDCFPAAQVQAMKIKRDIGHRFVDYFCENNAEAIITFMNGKFFECVMPKQFEMRGCLRTFFATLRYYDNVPLTTSAYCKSIDDFFNCTATILQQCELSQSQEQQIVGQLSMLCVACSVEFIR